MNTSNIVIYGDGQEQQRDETAIQSLFEGLTNKTLIDEAGMAFIQIKQRGIFYRVDIAATQRDAEKVERFVGENTENSRTIHAYRLTYKHGAGKIVYLENATGSVVAATQVFISPIPEYPQLAEDEAFCYSVTVQPGEEEKAYTRVLFKAQEMIAREAGKRRITCTSHVERVRDIRARLRGGFRIVGYSRLASPPTEDDGMLLLEKQLLAEPLPFDVLKQAERVKTAVTSMLSLSDQEATRTPQALEIAIPVTLSGERDRASHRLIEKAIASAYIGTGLLHAAEYNQRSGKQSLFIFQQKESLPIAETLSLPIRVHSEFGKLRRLIASYPPEAAILKPEYATNAIARSNVGNIDAIAIKEEYEGLLEALRNQQVDIVYTSSLASDGRTAMFTRDPAFVIGETFIIGASAKEPRRYEAEGMRRLSRGINPLEVGKDEGTFIEGGDVIFIEDKVVAVGIGERTNEAALQKLQEVFDEYTFIGVRHTHLHLDVLFTVVGRQKALADITQLPPEFIAFLQEKAAYEIIVADPQEQITLGCNVLAIESNKVIAVAENRITNQRLRARGVEVIEVSMPNIIKEGGGPRCLACPISRG